MRRFSHDSMTYVDVARNLRAGNGLTQIAGLAGLGLGEADAALAIPAASWPLIVLAGAWLLWRLYDGPTALWGALLLSVSHPLAVVATAAWSEAPAMSRRCARCFSPRMRRVGKRLSRGSARASRSPPGIWRCSRCRSDCSAWAAGSGRSDCDTRPS